MVPPTAPIRVAWKPPGGGRLGSDGDQAGQCTVECHGQISLAEQDAGNDQCCNESTSCRGVGVHEHLSDCVGVFDVGHGQLRAAVEAEPAHPQDEGTQCSQRQIGTGDRIDLTVGAILALARTEYQDTCQSSSSACHVHDTGTGVIAEAGLGEEPTAPAPVALDRVDEAGHDYCEGQEGKQLHALGNRTGDDRHGGRDEYHLEEEVRAVRIIGRILVTGSRRGQNICRIVFSADQQTEARQDAAFAAGVHDVVTDQQIHNAGDGIERHVLGQDLGRVLGTNEARLEHGKARRHPHDQRAAQQKVKGIKRILDLYDIFHNKPPK